MASPERDLARTYDGNSVLRGHSNGDRECACNRRGKFLIRPFYEENPY